MTEVVKSISSLLICLAMEYVKKVIMRMKLGTERLKGRVLWGTQVWMGKWYGS